MDVKTAQAFPEVVGSFPQKRTGRESKSISGNMHAHANESTRRRRREEEEREEGR